MKKNEIFIKLRVLSDKGFLNFPINIYEYVLYLHEVYVRVIFIVVYFI